jgi:hypothetical protein
VWFGTVFAKPCGQSVSTKNIHTYRRVYNTYEYYVKAFSEMFDVHLSLQEHDAYEVQCSHRHSTQAQPAVPHFETMTSKKG